MKNCNLSISISVLACQIAEGKTLEEIHLLSAFFVQLGETLDTIASQEELCAARCKKSEEQ